MWKSQFHSAMLRSHSLGGVGSGFAAVAVLVVMFHLDVAEGSGRPARPGETEPGGAAGDLGGTRRWIQAASAAGGSVTMPSVRATFSSVQSGFAAQLLSAAASIWGRRRLPVELVEAELPARRVALRDTHVHQDGLLEVDEIDRDVGVAEPSALAARLDHALLDALQVAADGLQLLEEMIAHGVGSCLLRYSSLRRASVFFGSLSESLPPRSRTHTSSGPNAKPTSASTMPFKPASADLWLDSGLAELDPGGLEVAPHVVEASCPPCAAARSRP